MLSFIVVFTRLSESKIFEERKSQISRWRLSNRDAYNEKMFTEREVEIYYIWWKIHLVLQVDRCFFILKLRSEVKYEGCERSESVCFFEQLKMKKIKWISICYQKRLLQPTVAWEIRVLVCCRRMNKTENFRFSSRFLMTKTFISLAWIKTYWTVNIYHRSGFHNLFQTAGAGVAVPTYLRFLLEMIFLFHFGCNS